MASFEAAALDFHGPKINFNMREAIMLKRILLVCALAMDIRGYRESDQEEW